MAFQFIRPFEILQGITTFRDNNKSGKAKKAIKEGKNSAFSLTKRERKRVLLTAKVLII